MLWDFLRGGNVNRYGEMLSDLNLPEAISNGPLGNLGNRISSLLFLPVFWSPVHFPKQAGTMGLLLHPRHPVFRHFPTEMNSDWQWWNVVKRIRVMVLDEMPTVTPLIESVDNFVHNRRLSLMFEAQMGKGSIVVSSIEMATNLPEMRHLLYSTATYMASDDFAPKADITPQQLRGLFGNSTTEQQTDAMSIYQ